MNLSPRVVYQQGDHVCTLFSSPEEQLETAAEYIQSGLERGERCLYVCGEHTPDEFRAALRRGGIATNTEERRGALILLTKKEGHVKGGTFSATRMIDILRAAVADALKAGFKGLCATGDMTWLLDDAPGSEEFVEYETLLSHFYGDPNNHALGLCQYNRRTLPATVLDRCLATHKHIRVEGPMLLTNPFYELPEIAMSRPHSGSGVHEKLSRIDAMTASVA